MGAALSDCRAVALLLECVLVHKFFVALAAVRANSRLSSLGRPRSLRVPLRRMALHDLSKLLCPSELLPYARYYAHANCAVRRPVGLVLWSLGLEPPPPTGAEASALRRAAAAHCARNAHHVPDHLGDGQRARDADVLEMVCDWEAASRAYACAWPGSDWPRVRDTLPRLLPRLHGANARLLLRLLDDLGHAGAAGADLRQRFGGSD
eukprot:m51a1_g2337 hypothetical protein (207) ;mRNA; f:544112-544732